MKQKVLDVGCWGGERVKTLLDEGYDAWGIDITDKHFKNAPKHIQERLSIGDITTILKITPEEFDKIYLTEVLEHINKDKYALQNIHYLLKEKGILIITTPRSIPFLEFWDPAWIKWKLRIGERHYHYTKKELVEILEEVGFRVTAIKSTGDIKWLIYRWLNGLGFKSFISYEKNFGYFDWEVTAIK